MILDALRGAVEVYEPDDAIGLAGLVIIGLPSIIAALAGVMGLIGQRRDRTRSKLVGTQVNEVCTSVNGRPTKLREDVDGLIANVDQLAADMRAGFRRLERDIGGLREEQRTERAERIRGDERP